MNHIANEKDPGEYLDVLNDFISFHANGGRIRDSIINIYLQFGLAEKTKLDENVYRIECSDEHVKKLKGIFEARNIILDGCKIPIAFKKGFTKVATPRKGEDRHGYGKNEPWENLKDDDFQLMKDYLTETFTEVLNGLISCLQDIKDRVYKLCDDLDINVAVMMSKKERVTFFEGRVLEPSFLDIDASSTHLITSGSTE